MSTRRVFLRNSALAMVGVGSAPAWLERARREKLAAPMNDAPLPADVAQQVMKAVSRIH